MNQHARRTVTGFKGASLGQERKELSCTHQIHTRMHTHSYAHKGGQEHTVKLTELITELWSWLDSMVPNYQIKKVNLLSHLQP